MINETFQFFKSITFFSYKGEKIKIITHPCFKFRGELLKKFENQIFPPSINNYLNE